MFIKFNRFKLFILEDKGGGGGGMIGDSDRVNGGGVSGRAYPRVCVCVCVAGCTIVEDIGGGEGGGDDSGDGNLLGTLLGPSAIGKRYLTKVEEKGGSGATLEAVVDATVSFERCS